MFKRNQAFMPIIVIFSIIMSSFVIIAQDVGVDDEGNPNDPTINERANACYTDPRLLDQCDTDYEWALGYALIRYEYGLISAEEMERLGYGAYLPQIILLDEINSEEGFTFPTVGCFERRSGVWGDFGGSNAITDLPLYDEDTCQTRTGTLFGTLVYAPEGQEAAEILCTTNFAKDFVTSQGNDIFLCS